MSTKLLCLSLLILNLLLHISTTAESATSTTDFIKSSCMATRYPVACVESLSGYANKIRPSEEELASTAMSVSVSKTRSFVSSLEKMGKTKGLQAREYNAVQDCIENMNDSVDNLNRSMKELGLLGKGKDSRLHISNIQTWVSAAMTYQDTCLDSINDANFKSSIKPMIVDASQVTSNALALVNRFASKYRT